MFNWMMEGRKLKNLNLKTILQVSAVLITAVFIFAQSYFLFTYSSSKINSKIKDFDESVFNQVEGSLTLAMDEMEILTVNIAHDKRLLNKIENYDFKDHSVYDKALMTEEIEQILSTYKVFYQGIFSIEFYSHKNTFSSSKEIFSITLKDILKSDFYESILNSDNNVIVFNPDKENLFDINSQSGLGFATSIFDEGVVKGIVVVRMKKNWFEDLFQKDIRIFITEKGKDVPVWTNQDFENELIKKLINNINSDKSYFELNYNKVEYRVLVRPFTQNGWYISNIHKPIEVYAHLYKIRNYSFLLGALSIIIGAILSGFVAKYVTKPIDLIVGISKKKVYNGRIPVEDKAFGKKSFRSNVMIYFIGMLILPMSLFTATYFYAASSVFSEATQSSILQAFRQTMNKIRTFTKTADMISKNLSLDRDLQLFISNKNGINAFLNGDDYNTLKELVEISNLFTNIQLGVCVYDKDGSPVFSYNCKQQKLDAAALGKMQGIKGDFTLWNYSGKDNKGQNSLQYIRKVMRTISNEEHYGTMDHIGFVALIFNEKDIRSMYDGLNYNDSNLYLYNEDGYIFSSNDKTLIDKKASIIPDKSDQNDFTTDYIFKRNENESIVISVSSNDINWFFEGRIAKDNIIIDNSQLLFVSLIIFCMATILILLVSYLVSFTFTKSINILKDRLVDYTSGEEQLDFQKDIEINEIVQLAETFNYMTGRIKDLIHEVYESKIREVEIEREKKDSELNALQAQINPHFLYNTFESIKWLIKGKSNDKAFEMVSKLGDLFRLSANREMALVTISQEIEYSKTYVNLQKLRFEDSLECTWNIENKALDCMILKLVLQPLIENCINHNMNDIIKSLHITVNISIKDDRLINIEVCDNGKGVEKQKLYEIEQMLNGLITTKSIGIYNIHKRVRLYFGDEYGISINNIAGGGTKVKISIPKIENLFII